MLEPREGALWEPTYGAGRAPGKRRRNGARLIGLGAAGFLALMVDRLAAARVRLVGRLPLPDPLPLPLPDFFLAMARSRCLPYAVHSHIKHAIYSSPSTLADSRTSRVTRGEPCSSI